MRRVSLDRRSSAGETGKSSEALLVASLAVQVLGCGESGGAVDGD